MPDWKSKIMMTVLFLLQCPRSAQFGHSKFSITTEASKVQLSNASLTFLTKLQG